MKIIQSMYKKCCEENHVDLLFIGEEGKKPYVLIKNFNTFVYDHILHHVKKHFCYYCLQPFSTEEILKLHIKDCFKTNGKKRITMPEKGEYIKLKSYERINKSPFIFYADFANILVPEDNGQQNPDESYTSNY